MHKTRAHPDNPEAAVDWLRDVFAKVRTRWLSIEVKEYQEKRSLGVNSFYWAVVIHYFNIEYHGPPAGKSHDKSTQQRMHDILGQRFRVFTDEATGLPYVKGTSTMTGREFWLYLDQCFQLYQDYFNGNIPLPESEGYLPRSLTDNDRPAT